MQRDLINSLSVSIINGVNNKDMGYIYRLCTKDDPKKEEFIKACEVLIGIKLDKDNLENTLTILKYWKFENNQKYIKFFDACFAHHKKDDFYENDGDCIKKVANFTQAIIDKDVGKLLDLTSKLSQFSRNPPEYLAFLELTGITLVKGDDSNFTLPTDKQKFNKWFKNEEKIFTYQVKPEEIVELDYNNSSDEQQNLLRQEQTENNELNIITNEEQESVRGINSQTTTTKTNSGGDNRFLEEKQQNASARVEERRTKRSRRSTGDFGVNKDGIQHQSNIPDACGDGSTSRQENLFTKRVAEQATPKNINNTNQQQDLDNKDKLQFKHSDSERAHSEEQEQSQVKLDDVQITESPNKSSNFKITDELEAKTPLQRFNDNCEAIRTLKELEKENSSVNKKEQEILAKYSGFGGLGEYLKSSSKHKARLAELITEQEFEQINTSLIVAYYTPKEVVKAIWAGVKRLGFKQGLMLEPSIGTSKFVGLQP